MDCLKNLTACMGCTKKHAKCSWKDVREEELRDGRSGQDTSSVDETNLGAEADLAEDAGEVDKVAQQSPPHDMVYDAVPARSAAAPAPVVGRDKTKILTPPAEVKIISIGQQQWLNKWLLSKGV